MMIIALPKPAVALRNCPAIARRSSGCAACEPARLCLARLLPRPPQMSPSATAQRPVAGGSHPQIQSQFNRTWRTFRGSTDDFDPSVRGSWRNSTRSCLCLRPRFFCSESTSVCKARAPTAPTVLWRTAVRRRRGSIGSSGANAGISSQARRFSITPPRGLAPEPRRVCVTPQRGVARKRRRARHRLQRPIPSPGSTTRICGGQPRQWRPNRGRLRPQQCPTRGRRPPLPTAFNRSRISRY